ncbi:Peptidase A22, presenilin signal peptide domain-containing protein [Rozella allomycis CSF55]|uniref:Peptidase A22, presenilin signal peptide domain-containing protein n=1 Tax=Rozella allomycis (strain CSF55) TaxID=988480 RepID=A0A075AP70_ROZAC|nr:Peptidase A22, presenilin signal peptide domain-containing protein [Rozella allomycis CSF55]|eukprot:EPZ31834.1 Peptidase A22, presenilin signal peptide domain-containing protein [Rozella allomycis CSF55]
MDAIYLTYTALIILAVIPIYVGSHYAADSSSKPESETVSANDAYLFPVYGSGVLFGLYLLVNYLSKEYLNYLLAAYFGIFGAMGMAKIVDVILRAFIPPAMLNEPYVAKISHKEKTLFHLEVDWLNAFSFVLAVSFTGVYLWCKNWIMSNVFGEAFSIQAISLLELDSFGTGMILLSGLFLYDIFWVFGTDVMVTVAKSFDIPIKLLFPRDVFAPSYKFALLGLGDIVIPGIYVAMCLKFDRHLTKTNENHGKPYFKACLLAYILGLSTTMAVMHIFNAAQPALLYLSPACILSSVLMALYRGEFSELLAFTTIEDVKDKKKSE